MPDLLPHHLEQLTQGSGISAEIISARGYCSIVPPEGYGELKRLGFANFQAKQTPGLLIPIMSRNGQPVLYQLRPDTPRILGKQGEEVKYETPSGASVRLDFATGQGEMLDDPQTSLWITEGIKKTDALRTHGLCAIGLLGVWCWQGTNERGGKSALPEWREIALNGRDIYIVFDSDVSTKPPVQKALKALQGFLSYRGARPHVVLLPAEGAAKVGIDDYLLTHSAEELRKLAEGDNSLQRALDAPSVAYRATDAGLQWLKQTRDGDVWVSLTNFTAKIISDIVRDDGAEKLREYEIEAERQGKVSRFTIPAAQFPGMNWPTEHLGAQSMVYPGLTLKDHARAAIQVLSHAVIERRIFTHSGWRRTRDDEWFFFHGGGVLGANGHVPDMDVNLPEALSPLALPEPTSVDALLEAVGASIGLLDAATDTVSIPLWAAIWRAVLGESDVSLHLTGGTGNGKTALAVLAQQHFGSGFDVNHVPGSWLSTGNSLEALAFQAKDVLFVIDDFVPGGSSQDVARMHREADRVLRAQGNRAGRGRMRADGSLRPAKPPRGLIVSTGEDIPRGQSLRARLVVVDVGPNDTQWKQLTACQVDAARGLYAQAMAAYLRWLAPRYGATRAGVNLKIRELHLASHQAGQHRRIANNLASLTVGVACFLNFAQDIGAITIEATHELWVRCWKAFHAVAVQQGEHQASQDPARLFLALLSGALASGRVHVTTISGGMPSNPDLWGWRDEKAQGKRIGWTDETNLFLEPEASFAEVQALAAQQGATMAVSAQTLRKRLAEGGFLQTTGKEAEGRQTLMVRREICGTRRNVLHLKAETLIPHEQPDQPDRALKGADEHFDFPPVVRFFPDHWSGQNGTPDHGKRLAEEALSDSGQVGQVVHNPTGSISKERQNEHQDEAAFWSDAPQKPDHSLRKNLTTRNSWVYGRPGR